ncbi:MAG: TetR/AcrR family transcriptional regulator [Methanobacterium sp.]
MSEETKEIILSAALKVFSEEGYVGAKTRLIAEEAGFSEMTLFRKFKSKENLFDTVLIEQKVLILNEVSALSRENKIEDSILSLSYLIRQLYRLIEDYFPYISIYINENRRTSECILDEFVIYLAGEIQLRFPDVNVNIRTLAFNVLYYLYYLVFDKNKDYSTIDPEEGLNEFIGNVITILTA